MRNEFTAKTKLKAFEAAHGHCVRCTAKLYPGKIRYNHRIPDYLTHDNGLDNCEVLCVNCDHPQTYEVDIPAIAKTRRIIKKHAGIKKPRRMKRWRRFDGSIVEAT